MEIALRVLLVEGGDDGAYLRLEFGIESYPIPLRSVVARGPKALIAVRLDGSKVTVRATKESDALVAEQFGKVPTTIDEMLAQLDPNWCPV